MFQNVCCHNQGLAEQTFGTVELASGRLSDAGTVGAVGAGDDE